jgi:trimeric autotransporter adhesin
MQRFRLASIFASLAVLAACGGGGTQHNSLSSILAAIQVSGPSANLVVGQSQQLKATGLYADESSHDVTASVSWSSSDNNIAGVATGGMLTAKSSGNVVITATLQGISGTFNVAISPALVSIAITPNNPIIANQTTTQFIATGTYSDNSQQNITGSVNWSSSDSSVATISNSAPTLGFARAASAGNTTITASSGSVSANTTLTVTSATATSLAITPVTPTISLGQTQQFTATATFSDNSKQDVSAVTQWKSSATNVASITTSGLASGLNVGSTTVSGAFETVGSSTVLTVNAANLNSISIEPGDATIAQGTQQRMIAKGAFNDGSTRDISFLVTWKSSNTAAVSIGSGNALAFGNAPGMATITAALGSVQGSTPLTVSNATIASVLVSPANPSIATGTQQHFTATGVFSDSTNQDITGSVTWSSDNTGVATINNLATATGISAGNATIKATFSFAGFTQSGTSILTVTPATLSSLSLSPSTAAIAPASSQQYIATGTFSDGTKANVNTLVNWSTSDPNVASVSNPGVITGQSSGQVTVTAQQGSISASAHLLVEGSTLISLQVTPQNSSVAEGFETQMKATGTFSDGQVQDLTAFATWTSSDATIATISNTQVSAGRATGVAPGSAKISAVFAGQSGTATLTVTNATLTSIAVSPSSTSIPVGTSQQFTATGTFSDNSQLPLLDQVTWASSNPNVATITSGGIANGLASGSTTISASLKGVKGSAILTVQ